MYALVSKSNSSIVRTWKDKPTRVSDPDNPNGALSMGDMPIPFETDNYVLDEVTVTGYEPFDPNTQTRTGPNWSVDGSYHATAAYTITDMTAEEIESEKEAEAQGALDADKVRRVFAKVAFEQENRIRALEGRPAVTAGQFKQYLIDEYKAT